MSILDILQGLIPMVGDEAVRRATDALKDLGAEKNGYAKILILAAADAVKIYGPKGLDLAVQALKDLEEGETVSLDWASPRTASEMLALMQQKEAGERDDWARVREQTITVLGVLVSGIVQAFTAESN